MMTEEELKELSKDTEHLCQEVGKFLNKWKGKLFKPLEKALEMLEAWLSDVK
jgi:chaperonin cofactor prefoldin